MSAVLNPVRVVGLVPLGHGLEPGGVSELRNCASYPRRREGEVVVQVDAVRSGFPVAIGGGAQGAFVHEWTQSLKASVYRAPGAPSLLDELGNRHLEGYPSHTRDDRVDETVRHPFRHVESHPRGVGERGRYAHGKLEVAAPLRANLVEPFADTPHEVGHKIAVLVGLLTPEYPGMTVEVHLHAVDVKPLEHFGDHRIGVVADLGVCVVLPCADVPVYRVLRDVLARTPDEQVGVFLSVPAEPGADIIRVGGSVVGVVAVHPEAGQELDAGLTTQRRNHRKRSARRLGQVSEVQGFPPLEVR